MKRDPGFYWVNQEGKWEVAEWYVGGGVECWYFAGCEGPFDDKDIIEIDERRIERLI